MLYSTTDVPVPQSLHNPFSQVIFHRLDQLLRYDASEQNISTSAACACMHVCLCVCGGGGGGEEEVKAVVSTVSGKWNQQGYNMTKGCT
jgi:hypothetical protein